MSASATNVNELQQVEPAARQVRRRSGHLVQQKGYSARRGGTAKLASKMPAASAPASTNKVTMGAATTPGEGETMAATLWAPRLPGTSMMRAGTTATPAGPRPLRA